MKVLVILLEILALTALVWFGKENHMHAVKELAYADRAAMLSLGVANILGASWAYVPLMMFVNATIVLIVVVAAAIVLRKKDAK